jgi:hypothetical protein
MKKQITFTLEFDDHIIPRVIQNELAAQMEEAMIEFAEQEVPEGIKLSIKMETVE